MKKRNSREYYAARQRKWRHERSKKRREVALFKELNRPNATFGHRRVPKPYVPQQAPSHIITPFIAALPVLKEQILTILEQKQPKERYVEIISNLNKSEPTSESLVCIGDWYLMYYADIGKLFFQFNTKLPEKDLVSFEAPLFQAEDGSLYIKAVNELSVMDIAYAERDGIENGV